MRGVCVFAGVEVITCVGGEGGGEEMGAWG